MLFLYFVLIKSNLVDLIDKKEWEDEEKIRRTRDGGRTDLRENDKYGNGKANERDLALATFQLLGRGKMAVKRKQPTKKANKWRT